MVTNEAKILTEACVKAGLRYFEIIRRTGRSRLGMNVAFVRSVVRKLRKSAFRMIISFSTLIKRGGLSPQKLGSS